MNWDALHLRVASRTWRQWTVPGSAATFVLDDTRALLVGALDELKPRLGDSMDLVMASIDLPMQRFLVQALQLYPLQPRLVAA